MSRPPSCSGSCCCSPPVPDIGAQYFAGWLIEKSLSVDNLFVFAVILSQFAVPARHQQKVLLYGVLGALVLRVIFIALGAAAIERFAITFVFFGAFLIYTAVKLATSHDEEPDLSGNRALKLMRRIVPVAQGYDDSGRMFTRLSGRRAATPLLAVTVVILSVDIVFALDSIPAIFGITSSAYLVVSANAFALLGLRALYFLLVGLLDRLVYLSYGLAVVLGFIGVKLVLHYLHTDISDAIPEISTALSLIVVIGVLTLTTVLSLRRSRDTGQSSAADDPAAPGSPGAAPGGRGAGWLIPAGRRRSPVARSCHTRRGAAPRASARSRSRSRPGSGGPRPRRGTG